MIGTACCAATKWERSPTVARSSTSVAVSSVAERPVTYTSRTRLAKRDRDAAPDPRASVVSPGTRVSLLLGRLGFELRLRAFG
jgi:hypothetical protein